MAEIRAMALDEFLRDHTEYIPDVKQKPVGGQLHTALTPDAWIAYAEWLIATERGDPVQGREFLEQLRKAFGR